MDDEQAEWMAAMRRGDYRSAWAVSDGVLAARDPATRDDPAQDFHRRWVWDGRDPSARHVLVRCYHGLGDTLQFARFLPRLRERVASLTLEVQPELMGLFARLPGPDRIVPFSSTAPSQPSECDIEIMELAHLLRMPPDAVPPARLALAPPAAPAVGIGLCWRAGGWDPARSAPLPPLLAALRGRPATVLQPGPVECAGFVNPQGCPRRIEQTARLISGLALVITVDTMVAHLAGTLGRPTWLLLRHAADWRWMDGRADTPWYPSMRLIRQSCPGDWDAVARDIRRGLDDICRAQPSMNASVRACAS